MSFHHKILNKIDLIIFESKMQHKSGILKKLFSRLFGGTPPSMNYKIKDDDGQILMGTRISNTTFIDHPTSLKLGENVYIGHFNIIEASNGMTIEEGVQITSHCVITTHSSHHSIRLYGKKYNGSEMLGYVKGSIHIGKYSFIGPHSTIMPNSQIGKGSLISAYSYVKGSFPDFAILAGNPATVVGDTRQLDAQWLEKHPELKANYNAWI